MRKITRTNQWSSQNTSARKSTFVQHTVFAACRRFLIREQFIGNKLAMFVLQGLPGKPGAAGIPGSPGKPVSEQLLDCSCFCHARLSVRFVKI